MNEADKIEVIKLLEAKKKIQADSVLKNYVPSLIQRQILFDNHKIVIIQGANRSGKSDCLSADCLIRSTGVVPENIREKYPMENIRHGLYWLSAINYNFMRDVVQEKIEKLMPKRMMEKHLKDDRIYKLSCDCEIGLKSQESQPDSYAGTSRVYIGLDEEHKEQIFNECYMRTTDCAGILRISFIPLKGLTWMHSKLYKKASRIYYTVNKHKIEEGLGVVHTPEQIAKLKEREMRCRVNTSSDADPDIIVYKMSIYDNVHLPDAEIQRAERQWKDSPVDYNARVLGNYAKITGREVFGAEMLMKMMNTEHPQPIQGDVIKGQFVKSVKGKLTLFKPLEYIKKRHCVIGGDCSEGLSTGDYSCAQIIDHVTKEQLGIWHGHISPEGLSHVLVELARFFNNAWLAPERNFHGIGVVSRIRDHFKYPYLYCEYDLPQHAIKQERRDGVKRYGWDTNSKTKPLMIQNLASALSEGRTVIHDPNTISELQDYVYHDNGKLGAKAGCFDDRVIAYAIALMVSQKRAPKKAIKRVVGNRSNSKDRYTGY